MSRERRALAELLALFHAVNSNHIKGRNPYAFPAVKLANEVLTGNGYESGFNVGEALASIRQNDGKALIFAGCLDGCSLSYGDEGDTPVCVNCGAEHPEENG